MTGLGSPPPGIEELDLVPMLLKFDAITLRTSFMALGAWQAMEVCTGVHFDGGIYSQRPLPHGSTSDTDPQPRHATLPGTASQAMADRVRYGDGLSCAAHCMELNRADRCVAA